MSKTGEFYAIEGSDGSGKSFQARLLSLWYQKNKIDCVLTEEHWRQDVLGQAIDAVVEHKMAKLDPLALQMTFVANRVNHTSVIISPGIEKGSLVITDRYAESTIAYANDEDRVFLINLTNELIKMGKIIRPDLTILIDVPVEVALERLELRRLGKNQVDLNKVVPELVVESTDASKLFCQSIFEKRPKLERVRNNYLERFNRSDERMVIVDGVGTAEEVHERLKTEIRRRSPLAVC